MTRILALDPGLAAFGASVLDERGEIIAADALDTEPNTIRPKRPRKPGANKRRRRLPVVGGVAFDTDRRIGLIWDWISAFSALHCPDVVVAESPGGSALGFTAAIALGTASTIASLLAHTSGSELVRVGVKAWRRTYVPGVAKIPDEDLYDAIGKVAASRAADELKIRGRSANLLVHVLDSVGIGRWAINFSSIARRALGIDVGGL